MTWSAAGISSLPLSARLERCPDWLQVLVREAVVRVGSREVILYGSRARGDATAHSDFDLAFGVPAGREAEWLRFKLDAEDNARTLYRLDLVNLAAAPMELRSRIRLEGIPLYAPKEAEP